MCAGQWSCIQMPTAIRSLGTRTGRIRTDGVRFVGLIRSGLVRIGRFDVNAIVIVVRILGIE